MVISSSGRVELQNALLQSPSLRNRPSSIAMATKMRAEIVLPLVPHDTAGVLSHPRANVHSPTSLLRHSTASRAIVPASSRSEFVMVPFGLSSVHIFFCTLRGKGYLLTMGLSSSLGGSQTPPIPDLAASQRPLSLGSDGTTSESRVGRLAIWHFPIPSAEDSIIHKTNNFNKPNRNPLCGTNPVPTQRFLTPLNNTLLKGALWLMYLTACSVGQLFSLSSRATGLGKDDDDKDERLLAP